MGGQRGSHNQVPVYQADIDHWVLTGAFNYTEDEHIQSCCINSGKCYQPESSCFRPVYLRKYLQLIGVPADAEKQKASWTLGALLCSETNCLSKVESAPVCRWSAHGCLK